MSAMLHNASNANAYAKVGLETGVMAANPHQLILMLFDGAAKEVVKARMAMQKNDVVTKCAAVSKAMAIIQDGLQSSLDLKAGGEIAKNLNDLYAYMCDRLLIANMRNEIEPLDQVGRLLAELKGAWVTIGQPPLPAR